MSTNRAYDTPQWRTTRRTRMAIARANHEPCCRCGQDIDYTLHGNHRYGPTCDHLQPLALGGDIAPPLELLAPAHRACNSRHGSPIGHANKRANKLGLRRPDQTTTASSWPNTITPMPGMPFVSGESRRVPVTLSEHPREPGDRDGLPRMFPDPHPEAVGSLGDEMVAWAEERRGSPLRWWQWLTAQRRYEVRADGTWCWQLVWTSLMRQVGKSTELTEDAAWNGSRGLALSILHAAQKVTTSRKIQSRLWKWAEDSGLHIARQLGASEIGWPDGSLWATVAYQNAYSLDPDLLRADEAWAMDREMFWDSMYPTLGDKQNPQSAFWSAANARDRGLCADLRGDPRVCRMEWGAFPWEDFMDPRVWRECTAYWTPARGELMRTASTKPGFAENWLNVWPDPVSVAGWLPGWGSCPRVVGGPPAGSVAAVEVSLDRSCFGVAVAAVGSDGRVGVWCRVAPDLERALGILVEWDPAVVWAGISLRDEANIGPWITEPCGLRETRLAGPWAADAVRRGVLAHDHDGLTAGQMAAARTTQTEHGELISAKRSSGPIPAAKAAVWAAWGAVSRPVEPPHIW